MLPHERRCPPRHHTARGHPARIGGGVQSWSVAVARHRRGHARASATEEMWRSGPSGTCYAARRPVNSVRNGRGTIVAGSPLSQGVACDDAWRNGPVNGGRRKHLVHEQALLYDRTASMSPLPWIVQAHVRRRSDHGPRSCVTTVLTGPDERAMPSRRPPHCYAS